MAHRPSFQFSELVNESIQIRLDSIQHAADFSQTRGTVREPSFDDVTN